MVEALFFLGLDLLPVPRLVAVVAAVALSPRGLLVLAVKAVLLGLLPVGLGMMGGGVLRLSVLQVIDRLAMVHLRLGVDVRVSLGVSLACVDRGKKQHRERILHMCFGWIWSVRRKEAESKRNRERRGKEESRACGLGSRVGGPKWMEGRRRKKGRKGVGHRA